MTKANFVTAFVATSLLIAVSAAPGQAGWQYTRWGMTIEEARQASHGAMQQLGENDDPYESNFGTERLRGRCKSADLTFVTSLFFDKNGHLTEVKMHPVDPKQAPAVVAVARAEYGSPDHQEAAGHSFYWYRKGDQIWLKADSGSAEISYCKRVVMRSSDRLKAGLAAILITGLQGFPSN